MEHFADIEGHFSEMVDSIHFLHKQGWAPATSSNCSFRVPGKEFYWISRPGIDKGSFSEADFMLTDKFGLPVTERESKASAETMLHILLYKQPSVNAILHTHSVNDTVLSAYYKSEKKIVLKDMELLKALDGIFTHASEVEIPIFENSQDMKALSTEIMEYHAKNPAMYAFLISGHGLYTWGDSISSAKRHVEALQFIFESHYRLLLLGRSGLK